MLRICQSKERTDQYSSPRDCKCLALRYISFDFVTVYIIVEDKILYCATTPMLVAINLSCSLPCLHKPRAKRLEPEQASGNLQLPRVPSTFSFKQHSTHLTMAIYPIDEVYE